MNKRLCIVSIPLLMMALMLTGLLLTSGQAIAQSVPCSVTYTIDADFNQGVLFNTNLDTPDQIQLSVVTAPPPFIWIACSGRGTAVRIDVNTGEILGEYYTAPDDMARNPSRTTVDLYGNVWVGNRDEASGGKGSIVKIALVIGGTRCNSGGTPDPSGQYLKPPFQYCTAVDRDFDGLIKTSTGLGNILTWSNSGGADINGGVSTADDECITHYVRTSGTGARTIAVDANNDVWVGGWTNGIHEKINGITGVIVAATTISTGDRGGYGGLIDGNGILWSSGLTELIRINTNVTPPTWTQVFSTGTHYYGLGIDPAGYIWNTTYAGNSVRKIHPSGAPITIHGTGGATYDRGVAVTPIDGHVWVANSGGSDVSRLNSAGAVLKVIPVGSMPTGVAVDANGKVWVTNKNSDNAMRIDPAGGGDNLGAVNLTVDLGAGSAPYNYSDMTGIVALGSTTWSGSWTITQQGFDASTNWGLISWNSSEPPAHR